MSWSGHKVIRTQRAPPLGTNHSCALRSRFESTKADNLEESPGVGAVRAWDRPGYESARLAIAGEHLGSPDNTRTNTIGTPGGS